MAFYVHSDCLHQVATHLDGVSLARLRSVCSFCASLKSETTVRYVATMRGHTLDLSTLEQIALAESLAELATEIRFRYREVTLDLRSLEPLARFAAVLRRHEAIKVSIEGHCGLEAPRAMGYPFTRERANSVKAVLVSHGVDDQRLTVRGYSNTRPLVWELGDAKGAANRRVELYVNIHGLEVPSRRPASAYATPPPDSPPNLTRLLLGTYVEDLDNVLEDSDEDDDDTDDEEAAPDQSLAIARILLGTGHLPLQIAGLPDVDDLLENNHDDDDENPTSEARDLQEPTTP
ncbi:hypothetical protein CTAYLR_006156 [Chrysophaeum taylorii]|uniref:OmpA-like domain-containing protein n=1 Tax=Chrysophaeum taylorii TaxID=2483200 RepID=A0AAD7UNX8_9STRA|nr:hypothetical protein CTAYLR_006156 [Chrysophaeum taylorii]